MRILTILTALSAVLMTSAQASEFFRERVAGFQQFPALGIDEDFGRWTGTVRLGYDNSQVHERFNSTEHFLALLEAAASQWELICGIRFEILPAGEYPDDRHSLYDRDGIVKVSWDFSADRTALGWAGPGFDFYDPALGYFPYDDGTITLNGASTWSRGDDLMVDVLVHELGHLIGLGHSDNPNSIMYANPYNGMRFLSEDDIRAAQALYGMGDSPESGLLPIKAWQHTSLPLVNSSTTQFLFTKNSHPLSVMDTGFVHADDPSSAVPEITEAISDDALLTFLMSAGSADNLDELIKRPVQVSLVQPQGYEYSSDTLTLECPPRYTCVRYALMVRAHELKNIPGEWKVYIKDDPQQVRFPRLLHEVSVNVATEPQFNRPPRARMVLEPGNSADTIRARVLAEDPENDEISVVWITPGSYQALTDRTEILNANGESQWREITFASGEQLTFFVEVSDDAPRYGDGTGSRAGSGFQTLLRVDIDASGDETFSARALSSSLDWNSDTIPHLLSVMAQYRSTAEWPAPYNGVAPDPSLALPYNNIGFLDSDALRINACVNVISSGGSEPYDVVFRILDIDEGLIQVMAARPFNEQVTLDSHYDLPDCSGQFDEQTLTYTDTVEVGIDTFAATFKLTDPEQLIFRLEDAVPVFAQ